MPSPAPADQNRLAREHPRPPPGSGGSVTVRRQLRLLAAGALLASACSSASTATPPPGPARGEALPPSTSVPTVVPQLRPAAAADVAFASPRTLALLDAQETLTLLDLDGTVRAVLRNAGSGPIEVHGGLLATSGGALDLATGRLWALPRGARPSPRGDRYALLDGAQLVIGRVGGEPLAMVPHAAGTGTLHWLPDGDRLVLCGSRGTELFDADGALLGVDPGRSRDCAPSPRGHAVARLDALGVVRLLDPETLALLAARASDPPSANRLAWSPDGHTIAAFRRGGSEVTLWNARSGEASELAVSGAIEAVAVAAQGRFIAVAQPDRTVVLHQSGALTSLDLGPARLAFDATSDRLVVATPEAVTLLDLSTGDGRLAAVTSALRATAAPASVGYSHPGSRVLLHAGGTTFGWGAAGVEVLDRFDAAELATASPWRFSPRAADGTRLDGDRYVLRAEGAAGCGVATRRGDGALVVLDGSGHERASLSFERGESAPCAEGLDPCGLPVAVSPDCAWVVIQRGELLRTFDGHTGEVVARRRTDGRARWSQFAITGSVLHDTTGGELRLFRAHDLTPLGHLELGRDAMTAAAPDGAWHARVMPGELAVLRASGEIVRVPLVEPTTRLTAAGEGIVRETHRATELRSPVTGAVAVRLDAAEPRHVVRASVDPPSLAVVHCDDGHLLLASSDGAPAELGTCSALEGFSEAEPGHVALVDRGHARIVALDGSGALDLEPFVTGDDSWMFVIDPSIPAVDGPPEHADSLLLRAPGPVLDAPLVAVVFD